MNNDTLPIGKAVPLAEYSPKSTNEIVFLFAISYEERGFESLKRTTQKFKIRKALIFQFNVKDYLTHENLECWEEEKQKVLSFLKEKDIIFELLDVYDDDFKEILKNIKKEISENDTVVIDITTFPKNYILKFCQELEDYNTVYQYTLGERYLEPTEEEKRVGVSKIIPIDGFEGDIEINGDTLLALILGFESNRALAFLNEFPSGKTLALIGAPGIGIREENEEDKKYLEEARQSNKHLLNNSFVRQIKVNSLGPFLFYQQLKDAIASNVEGPKPVNIVIAPIGTKAQTLGLYLYWKSNPKVQILYPIPNRRPKVALKTGETFIYRLSIGDSL
ncbi:MAG: hypothetical protein QMD82_08520 [bacterium]|nr:hypothetical protein [bacterium]